MLRALALALVLSACARPTDGVGRREAALAERERLPEELRARVDDSVVPVLLPRGLDLAGASLVVERTFSALSLGAPGITVSLHSVRIAHDHPGVEGGGAPRIMRGVTGHVTVNEGIRAASWIEDGVTHALDLECADAADARCADDAYLLALVEGLVFAGGGRPAP